MRYEAPDTIDAATGLLAAAGGNAHVLAGGTDLLVRLRAGFIDPELVVDIKRIEETRTIEEVDGGFQVGLDRLGGLGSSRPLLETLAEPLEVHEWISFNGMSRPWRTEGWPPKPALNS